MPAPVTGDEFLELVRKSGLVDADGLAACLKKLRGEMASLREPKALAESLVAEGLLTSFQADCLRHGKTRGFFIGACKVLELIGSGAMGSVFLCEYTRLNRVVAVKVLPSAHAQDVMAVARFRNEAQAMAGLQHANVAAVYEVGQVESINFFAMEYVNGSNLQQIVERSGPLEPSRAADYIAQAALGLQHAHERGVVHRDIEPTNILVDRAGQVKVVDFGLARIAVPGGHDDDFLKSYVEQFLVAVDYVAPEFAIGKPVAHTADIYSLGATFCFCLTGQPLFGEAPPAEKLLWRQSRRPTPIASLRPEIPKGMTAIIDRMLAKDPAERFAEARAVAEALAPWRKKAVAVPSAAEMPHHCPAVRRLLERGLQ